MNGRVETGQKMSCCTLSLPQKGREKEGKRRGGGRARSIPRVNPRKLRPAKGKREELLETLEKHTIHARREEDPTRKTRKGGNKVL